MYKLTLLSGTVQQGLIQSSRVTAAREFIADDTVDKDPENIPPTANPASPGIYNIEFIADNIVDKDPENIPPTATLLVQLDL